MFLHSLLYNPTLLRIALLSLGFLLALTAYLVYRLRRSQEWPPAATGQSQPSSEEEVSPQSSSQSVAFTWRTFQDRPSLSSDLLRGVLILLALLVAAGLITVLLPQNAIERVADSLRPRGSELPPQEKIAFLYLGDEVRGSEFHIRGVIRNIATQPVEQLDATIRLYARDRTLLETALVRMDSEIIPPDGTAAFHLTYPDYRGQLGSFSVDFKLRQGEPVPYKDMRGARIRE